MDNWDFNDLLNSIKNDIGKYTQFIEVHFAMHSNFGSSYFKNLENAADSYQLFSEIKHKDKIKSYCQKRYSDLSKKESEERDRQAAQDKFLKLSITDLENIVGSYGGTRNMAKASLVFSIIASIGVFIAPYLGKSDPTPKDIKISIDTSTSKSILQYQQQDRLNDSLSFYRIESYIDSLQTRIDSLEARSKKK